MRPAESFIAQPVRSLQTMLRVIAQEDNRQPSVIPDGIYGNQTTAAIAAFQRNRGIPARELAHGGGSGITLPRCHISHYSIREDFFIAQGDVFDSGVLIIDFLPCGRIDNAGQGQSKVFLDGQNCLQRFLPKDPIHIDGWNLSDILGQHRQHILQMAHLFPSAAQLRRIGVFPGYRIEPLSLTAQLR